MSQLALLKCCFLFTMFFCMLAPLGADAKEAVKDSWAIYFAVQTDPAILKAELARIEQQTGDDATFATAILYLNLCMLKWNTADANKGYKLLEKLRDYAPNQYLFFVYRGIASSFQGRIKTIFGLDDLKQAQAYLLQIPKDHANWVIRFLRGVTLINLAKGLPDIWIFTKSKAEARELGRADLTYVQEEYQRNAIGEFDLAAYNNAKFAVPRVVIGHVERLLKESEKK